jgi:hypothetical protein
VGPAPFGATPAASAANRSLILDFEVEDVDIERVRLDDAAIDRVPRTHDATVGESFDVVSGPRRKPHQLPGYPARLRATLFAMSMRHGPTKASMVECGT